MIKRKSAILYCRTIAWIGYAIVEFGFFVWGLNKSGKRNIISTIGEGIVDTAYPIALPKWVTRHL